MARLNKSETENKARDLVRGFTQLQSMTFEDVTALGDRKAREAKAREYAAVALSLLGADATRFPDVFTSEYARFVEAVFDGKLKQRENARKSWQRAIYGITIDAAQKKVTDLVESMHVRGLRCTHGDISINRLKQWSEDVRAYVRWERNYSTDETVTVNPDDATQRAGEYTLRFEISTGGTTRSLAEMAVVIKAQQDLLDVVTEVTAVMARERVIWTYGIPEEAPAEAAEAQS